LIEARAGFKAFWLFVVISDGARAGYPQRCKYHRKIDWQIRCACDGLTFRCFPKPPGIGMLSHAPEITPA
jgi:hypothetical protein